jgi:hypothetical protein
MFFMVSWRCVKNVVAHITTMRIAAATFALVPSALLKASESCAPKICDVSMSWATDALIGPIAPRVPSAICGRWLSTRNSAKKIGDCSSSGRQDANGFVPCLR